MFCSKFGVQGPDRFSQLPGDFGIRVCIRKFAEYMQLSGNKSCFTENNAHNGVQLPVIGFRVKETVSLVRQLVYFMSSLCCSQESVTH